MKKVLLIEDLGHIILEGNTSKKSYVKYLCTCGEEFICRKDYNPKYGCRQCSYIYRSKDNPRFHGESGTRLYKIHDNIKTRCTNHNTPSFHLYGGRGVEVCAEWLEDFFKFKEWAINSGYNDTLSIDRIDPNGNYSPSNCRWVTNNIQAQNTRLLRRNNTTGYRGVSPSKDGKKFCSEITWYSRKYHLGTYSTPEEAAIAYDNFVISNHTAHPLNFPMNGDSK